MRPKIRDFRVKKYKICRIQMCLLYFFVGPFSMQKSLFCLCFIHGWEKKVSTQHSWFNFDVKVGIVRKYRNNFNPSVLLFSLYFLLFLFSFFSVLVYEKNFLNRRVAHFRAQGEKLPFFPRNARVATSIAIKSLKLLFCRVYLCMRVFFGEAKKKKLRSKIAR